MKKLLTLIASIVITLNLFAQAPQKMSYQAVIRNASNNLVTNAPVKMRISILQGSATGTSVYSELHSATTNTNGLVSIEIGAGTSPTGTFSSINWGNGTYFLRTETDPNNGSTYSIIGTSQLLSVPYALQSNSSGNGFKGVSKTGDTLYLENGKSIIVPGISSSNNSTGSGSLATLTTLPIINITNSSAISGGNITSDGGTPVILKGVVWSTSPNPTVSLATKTSDGIGVGEFTSNIPGLEPNTTYYVRAYAINSTGSSYGNELSFKTTTTPPSPNNMTDIDGNS
jgi:hypothetical protein